MPINNSKLNKSASDHPEPTSPPPETVTPIVPAALLAAARDRHDRELADLQTHLQPAPPRSSKQV
jgi:hypothetical protein